MNLKKDIKSREMFHEVMNAYIFARERDTKRIASGRRGWSQDAKDCTHYMGTLCRYAVDAVKRGHPVSAAVDALAAGDAALCRYFAEMLYYERDMKAEWIAAVQLNPYGES